MKGSSTVAWKTSFRYKEHGQEIKCHLHLFVPYHLKYHSRIKLFNIFNWKWIIVTPFRITRYNLSGTAEIQCEWNTIDCHERNMTGKIEKLEYSDFLKKSKENNTCQKVQLHWKMLFIQWWAHILLPKQRHIWPKKSFRDWPKIPKYRFLWENGELGGIWHYWCSNTNRNDQLFQHKWEHNRKNKGRYENKRLCLHKYLLPPFGWKLKMYLLPTWDG